MQLLSTLFASYYSEHRHVKQLPSGKSLFPDVEAVSFLYGNKYFFLLARKSINYEEAYLNTVTNNCAD